MADEQHIQRLLEGVEVWNEWRERVGASHLLFLSDTNLYQIFRNAGKLDSEGRIPLAGINFGTVLLNKSILANANLAGADLSFASLNEAYLTDADVSGAEFLAGRFDKSNLSNANLSRTKSLMASFEEANLSGANLPGSNFAISRFANANLTNADLTDSDFGRADFSNANLFNSNLTGSNLANASLSGANLLGTRPWTAVLYSGESTLLEPIRSNPVHIATISDLLATIQSIGVDIPLYYRGESKLGWSLSPALFRDDFAEVEEKMLNDLISRRPHDFNGMATALDRWVLAQHQGLKTRFLDVTKNPLVGLFFACEKSEKHDDEDACLHIFAMPEALNKPFSSDTISVIANFARLPRQEQGRLLGLSIDQSKATSSDQDRYNSVMRQLYQLIRREQAYFEERIDLKDLYGVFVVEPQQSSERVRAQSGAFLVSAFRDRFDYPEDTEWNGGVRPYDHGKLTIPAECKDNILKEVRLLNITRETLFPGLDSSADAVTERYSQQGSA